MANISNLELGMHFWLQRRRIETRMPLLGNNNDSRDTMFVLGIFAYLMF
jgi:hypothetical protein